MSTDFSRKRNTLSNWSELTGCTPISLKKGPDAKDKATASKKPIPMANTSAVDTEDNCFLPTKP